MRAESLLGSPLGAQIGTFGREETRVLRKRENGESVCAIWEIACVRSQISLLLFSSSLPFFCQCDPVFESEIDALSHSGFIDLRRRFPTQTIFSQKHIFHFN